MNAITTPEASALTTVAPAQHDRAKYLGGSDIAAVLLILATCAMALVGCSGPSDLEAERATAAALQDAIAQAQAERPELWTPETIERADTAALIAAASRK